MAYPKLFKQRMLEWIRTTIKRGDPMPTDTEIAEAFRFDGVESARVLLAELADEQKIFIQWHDDGRTITLEKPKRAFAPARPIPDLGRKRDRDVDRATKRIMEIVNRKAKPSDGAVEPVQPRASSAKAKTAPAAKPSLAAPLPVADASPAAPTAAPFEPDVMQQPAPVPLPPIVERHIATRARQVNSKVPAAVYEAISGLAGEMGVAVSTMAGQLLDEALRERARPSWCKPKLTAAVMAAHARVGGDLGAFVTGLIEHGLAASGAGGVDG